MSPNLQTLLLMNQRNVIAEVLIQYPNPANNLQASGQILLDGILSLSITRNEESTSDTIDLTIANGDCRYTPYTHTTNFGALTP